MRIILASGSPRREQLLRELVDDFEIIPARIDEPSYDGSALCPEVWVESLAYLKAAEVAQRNADALIIAADTICLHSGRIIGKPDDMEHARDILTNYFAGVVRVITGIAILKPDKGIRIIDHVVTELTMRAMTERELKEYLASGTWQGKAGAYAYQEGGDKFVEKIQGSETNVVGLPVEWLKEKFDEVYKLHGTGR